MNAPRRLLAVSWCMPPLLIPRSVQVARLLKGLRRLGWASTVVTPALQSLHASDTIDSALGDTYEREFTRTSVDLSRVDPDEGPLSARWRQRLRGEDRLDLDELWTSRASRACARVNRRLRSEVLVTFAQPWRDHLVGLELRRCGWRRAWVAHFSDPWVDSLYADTSEVRRAADVELEARVVEQADRVVFTNRHAADLVMRKYPQSWLRKARVVPHAMDTHLSPVRASDPSRSLPLRLSHVGNLFAGRRTAAALFEALVRLKARRRLSDELQVVFLGEGSGLDEAREHVFVRRIEDVVTFRPRVPYFESLRFMQASDVLLVIDAPADVNVFLPSKVVDYLMAGRPVLALTPARGATADLMRELGEPIVDPVDPDAIAAAIEAILHRHAEGGLCMSPAADACARQFSLEKVSTAFAAVLDEAVRDRR